MLFRKIAIKKKIQKAEKRKSEQQIGNRFIFLQS